MLWRDLRAWQVYGANTDVGKTILSTILCKALARRASNNGLLYLKPVSTGPQEEADDRHIKRHAPGVLSRCISQFADPVSPHLAAKNFQGSSKVVQEDGEVVSRVRGALADHAAAGGRYALLETAGGVLSPAPSGTVQADLYRPLRLPALLMGDSKLGGIGTTISAFESLHIRGYDVESVLLFDDTKWGNHDYLQEHFSKHNIEAFSIPLPPDRKENAQEDQMALSEYYEKCSDSPAVNKLVNLLHQKHFNRISKLTSMSSHADSVIWHPFRQHQLPQNIIAIDSAYGDHFESYNPEQDLALNDPQSSLPRGLTPLAASKPQPPILASLFDASASWWTQGLGHGNPELALTAAHAAGRYGHVMFASAVHEPALDLTFNLLSTLQNPRLGRVFFTDNGSTGMEVAVKMALRATCQRYRWNKNDTDQPIGVIGLKGSYHGDTIGVMNCSEPSTFNEKVDWYRPWGHWFEPPEVRMKQGQWHITLPATMSSPTNARSPQTFNTLSSIFDFPSRQGDADFYKSYITETLKNLTHTQRLRFGALIIEPIIMGAGGMIFVDPLFQRTLITTIRDHPELIAPEHDHSSTTSSIQTNNTIDNNTAIEWKGLPFIADEVFTGLYRLGRSSSTSFLNNPTSPASTSSPQSSSNNPPIDLSISPDISVHAKLLTGGLLPLALTTASDSIFNTFLSDSKTDALLHGHSYTAHPIGCSVANKSLETMAQMSSSTSISTSPTNNTNNTHKDSTPSSSWQNYRNAWSPTSSTSQPHPFSFFSPETLKLLSKHPKIESCFALGTVLALTVKSTEGAGGYNSNAAASLQAKLLVPSVASGNGAFAVSTTRGLEGIHSRVLGDVIYFMTSLTTKPEGVGRLEEGILRALDEA